MEQSEGLQVGVKSCIYTIYILYTVHYTRLHHVHANLSRVWSIFVPCVFALRQIIITSGAEAGTYTYPF